MTSLPLVRVSERRAASLLPHDAVGLREAFGAGPWLVVVPHDDDLVLGLGLTVAAAAQADIDVHVAVATDGALGYVQPEERAPLIDRRRRELEAACVALGLAPARVHRLDLPDGGLVGHQGCRGPEQSPTLSQRLVELMRSLRPSSVFVCTPTDIHPDHRVAASETEIACFWASSRIWLELGEPIAEPARFHYAVYCRFDGEPDFEVAGSGELLEHKLHALSCFESQGVIDPMVARLRADGPFEYLKRASFEAYRPRQYRGLFERASAATTLGEGFRADCELVLDVLDGEAVGAELLAPLFAQHTRPVVLVGEGSSQLFPCHYARWLARELGLATSIDVSGGRDVRVNGDFPATLCLVSNSGATRELVDLVSSLGAEHVVALLGSGGGPLCALVPKHVTLLPRPERVVAATASVFAQSLCLGRAIAHAAGLALPMRALRDAITTTLSWSFGREIHARLPHIERVFWADRGTGVGAELSLKTMEVAGLMGQYLPGNLLLHGVEEILSERDLVVWFDAPEADRARRFAIAQSTGALIMEVGGRAPDLSLPELERWSPLVQLVAGWRIVESLALSHGRDPDRPRRARKVGNPAL